MNVNRGDNGRLEISLDETEQEALYAALAPIVDRSLTEPLSTLFLRMDQLHVTCGNYEANYTEIPDFDGDEGETVTVLVLEDI